MRRLALLLGLVVSFVGLHTAEAQVNNDQNAINISGQTGQSDNFAIQREAGAFIGGATTSILGGQGTAAAAAFSRGGLGGLGGFGRGNTGFGNQAGQQTAEPQIRFRLTLGFSHPLPSATQVKSTFTRRLSRIPQLSSVGEVSVTMEQRTVVLVGQVGTQHQRTLIEKLAMMEPGVSEVRNELTVAALPELVPLPDGTN